VRKNYRGATIALAAAVTIVWLVTARSSDEPHAEATRTWNPPRLPDGQPDISGVWESKAGGASYALEHIAIDAYGRPNDPDKRSATFIKDPEQGGKLPFQPWARARREDVVAHLTHPEPEHIDPQSRGFLDGVPRINYQEEGYTVVIQSAGYVAMFYEVQHAHRVIPLDGRPHVAKDVQLWMGDSRGHWEGNTLVVDVTNHNDRTWFSVAGEFHSDALRVVERWTFADIDTIKYEATIDDPKVYTRPWTIAFDKTRNKTAGFQLMEYAAIEGERDVQMMLEIPRIAAQQRSTER
jgi:hypothetical protein